MLLIVSYVVLGSITTAANTVSTAKKDMTLLQEQRLGTKIDVTYCHFDAHKMSFRIQNAGSTTLNWTELNFVVTTQGSPMVIYIGSTGNGQIGSNPVGNWSFDGIDEIVNPGQWDPGEIVYGSITLTPVPIELDAFTPNGASGSLIEI